MHREISPLVREWQVSAWSSSGREYKIYSSGSAALVCGGIGPGAAARAAAAIIESSGKPELLVSAGFAGALGASMKVGDSITPGIVIDAATGKCFQMQFGSGRLVSAISIAEAESKRNLAQRFIADAVDMEAAAVAEVAAAYGVAMAAVKAISDEADFAMPPMGDFVDVEGKFHTGSLVAYAAIRPKMWGALRQLAANARIASSHLCTELERLIERSSSTMQCVTKAESRRPTGDNPAGWMSRN